MRVLVRAPLLTNSGYGVHSRQVFEWLLEESSNKNFNLDVECLNWGSCPWIIDETKEGGLIGEIMSRSKKLEPPYDITFQIQLPDEWDSSLGKYNVGITAAVETDRCNPKWVEACNKMDSIVVPSTFTRNVLRRSGILTTNVNVIPEWYHDTIDSKDNTGIDLDQIKTSFNFLTIGLLTGQSAEMDRKNLIKSIEYFCENFKDNEDVGLIVKTSLGKYSSFDRLSTKKYFHEVVKTARKNKKYPKVYLIHGAMTKEEIASLYSHEKVKAYFTLTRGEGYGLPIIEAASSGLPIIATNYSGHLEFLNKECFLGIDYKLIDIPKAKIDSRIFVPGARWAEPDMSSCFTNLNEAYYNYTLRKQIAEEYSTHVKDTYSKESIKKMYSLVFKDVL